MTRQITVGGVKIGGGAPVSIQSMLNTATTDVEGSLAPACRAEAGRLRDRPSVPCRIWQAAEGFRRIAEKSPLPLVADIHFDYRLAIAAAEGGAAKIRINPGNIGGEQQCARRGGLLQRASYPHPHRGQRRQSGQDASGKIRPSHRRKRWWKVHFPTLLCWKSIGFYDICVSMKSSSVPLMMQAYRLMHERSDYPLHVGVTETGTEYMGTIKSAMGIGGLLCMGIGDTIRVSLTADPVREVYAAKAILKAAGLRPQGVNLISCPTCGRTKIDLIGLANRVEQALQDCDKNITVAVMGCVVNGPGEAREADVGIAGGDGCGVLFVKGELREKLPYDELLPALLAYIEKL